MSMIDYIEKLINEHGSSTILKERLELLRDQISILEKENGNLKSENAILKEKKDTTGERFWKDFGVMERFWGHPLPPPLPPQRYSLTLLFPLSGHRPSEVNRVHLFHFIVSFMVVEIFWKCEFRFD